MVFLFFIVESKEKDVEILRTSLQNFSAVSAIVYCATRKKKFILRM